MRSKWVEVSRTFTEPYERAYKANNLTPWAFNAICFGFTTIELKNQYGMIKHIKELGRISDRDS